MTAVLTTHDKQFLSQADQIIVLRQDGTIAEQGSYAELNATKGYVDVSRSSQDHPGVDESLQQDVTLPVSLPLPTNQVEKAQIDLARKTGDIAVYGYYIKSIGWKLSAIVILSSAISGFIENFPNL